MSDADKAREEFRKRIDERNLTYTAGTFGDTHYIKFDKFDILVPIGFWGHLLHPFREAARGWREAK